ncbi:MAG: TatD family hydrolase [Pseudomonadota bacterium]
MWIDSHCHLNDERFAGELDVVLDNAKRAGVNTMVTICTELNEASTLLDLANTHEELYCSVGVHPHEAQIPENQENLAQVLTQFAVHDKVIGLGETGLDYYYEHSPKDAQRQAFATHIDVAKHTKLPLIVHTRDAEVDTIDLLKAEQGNMTGVMHCFSGSQDLADKSLDLGFYISISGIVTFKKANDLKDIVKRLPLDRVLLETDAPYLAPVPLRGKRNEPAFMVHTAQVVADLMGITAEKLALATTENFSKLFNLSFG